MLTVVSDELQAQPRLLGATSRDHQRHAGHSGGLAGGGCPGVQASVWNSAPCCQLLGPLSVMHSTCETDTAAADCHRGVTNFCVSARLRLQRVHTASDIYLFIYCWDPTSWCCLICHLLGNTRRSPLLSWVSLCIAQPEPTPRSSCCGWRLFSLKYWLSRCRHPPQTSSFVFSCPSTLSVPTQGILPKWAPMVTQILSRCGVIVFWWYEFILFFFLLFLVFSRVELAGNGSIPKIHAIHSGCWSLLSCQLYSKRISLGMFADFCSWCVKFERISQNWTLQALSFEF